MTLRALVFIEDPGEANFILPVIAKLQSQGWHVDLRAAGAALAYIASRLQYRPAEPEAPPQELLASLKPDVVFVGVCENPDTYGLQLISAARAQNIPSVAAVDILAHADHRFRGRSNAPLGFAPDYIITADDPTREAFVSFGHPSDAVIATGHPHFDVVRNHARALEIEGRDAVRQRCLPHVPADRRVIVFVSEVSTGWSPEQFQRSSDYTLQGRGQRTARSEIVIEEFLDAARALPENPYLVLRLHPKNTKDEFGPLVGEFDHVSADGVPLDLVFASDAVVGMSTMLLFESHLLGRPTLAILPRVIERHWLPAEGIGVIPVVHTRADLRAALPKVLGHPVARSIRDQTSAAQRAADVLLHIVQKTSSAS